MPTHEFQQDVVQRLTRIETLLEPLAGHSARITKLEHWRIGLTVALGGVALWVGAKLGIPLPTIAALAAR